MLEALEFPFFQRALAAGLLASVACGVVGSFVVVRRMASISGGLAHAAFGGVGLGYLLGFDPMWGATGFALLSALIIGQAYFKLESGLDTLIAMVWSIGMALGMLFVSLTPGYAPDLMSYLFGSILFVPAEYVQLVAILDVVIVLLVWLLFKELQAVTFDEDFARVMGVPVVPVFLLLLALSALAVVTLIRVVGVILVIALLTIPAAIARQWLDNLRAMMVAASVLGALLTASGLFLSYALSEHLELSAPTGPLIIVLAVSLYAASSLLR
ncbi:MAG: metal ABC transporter permease, partial [Acidobacteriota bacterium]